MKKRHLLWLSVNSSYSHSSLALPLLHTACREIDGWEWSVLETTVGEDAAETAVRLAASDCDLVCATLYLFNRNAVLEILQRFHLLQPELPIAVGGPECLGDGAEELLARALSRTGRAEDDMTVVAIRLCPGGAQSAQETPAAGGDCG